MPKPQMVTLGPKVVSTYPHSAWSERISPEQLDLAWSLVGPTIERFIDSTKLWKLFSLCYLEGMAHGHGATMAALAKKPRVRYTPQNTGSSE